MAQYYRETIISYRFWLRNGQFYREIVISYRESVISYRF